MTTLSQLNAHLPIRFFLRGFSRRRIRSRSSSAPRSSPRTLPSAGLRVRILREVFFEESGVVRLVSGLSKVCDGACSGKPQDKALEYVTLEGCDTYQIEAFWKRTRVTERKNETRIAPQRAGGTANTSVWKIPLGRPLLKVPLKKSSQSRLLSTRLNNQCETRLKIPFHIPLKIPSKCPAVWGGSETRL